MAFDVTTFDVGKYDDILARGLCVGVGERKGMMCIEAAICTALDLPHGDDPRCVADSVRRFKIKLNDARWSSPQARAAGLRDLGLAQLGSRGVIDDNAFATQLEGKVIRSLIPELFRDTFPENKGCMDAADQCEADGSIASAEAARKSAHNLYSSSLNDRRVADACICIACASAEYLTNPMNTLYGRDEYLLVFASLALDVLIEMGSPGCALLSSARRKKQ